VPGLEVDFSTSFGSLSTTTGVTDSFGKVSTILSATQSGEATVKALAKGGAYASLKIALSVADIDTVAYDKAWLTEARFLDKNSSAVAVTKDLFMPAKGQNGCDIIWSSSDTNFVKTDGTVHTPHPAQGNQQVTLTAVIKKGTAQDSITFTVWVKVLDEDRVQEDKDALTEEWILNGGADYNTSLSDVTRDLRLSTTRLYDSEITWTSSDTAFVAGDGTVTRPAYTQGDKEVVLTAVLRYGNVQEEKTFTVTVKKLPVTDEERVALDMAWLDLSQIINGNTSADFIVGPLSLPDSGPMNTVIQWASSDEAVVAIDGTVTRPSYTKGTKTVRLTATIQYNSTLDTKVLVLTVPRLPQTEAEAVAADAAVLLDSILGINDSPYSVTTDLVLPTAGAEGSTITWSSNKPDVISNTGRVTRSANEVGHQQVLLTATLQKGGASQTVVLDFVVLALPDTKPPVINATSPGNGESDVSWDTREITFTFNENITQPNLLPSYRYPINGFGITFDGPSIPQMSGWISENKLIISLSEDMAPGEYTVKIKKGVITDLSKNKMQDDFTLTFTVESKPANHISIVSSSPEDLERGFPVDSAIVIRFANSTVFNRDQLLEGGSFDAISLQVRDGNKVAVSAALSGDTLTIRPESGTLLPGTAYVLTIPEGVVRDRFQNRSPAKTILFLTEGGSSRPEVTGIYPADGQKDIDISQYLQVTFSEPVKAGKGKIRLTDETGRNIEAILQISGNILSVEPLVPLSPNTGYILTVPYNAVQNNGGLTMLQDQVISFTTGANALSFTGVSPRNKGTNRTVPINSIIELQFSQNILPNDEVAVEIIDSSGNFVAYVTEYSSGAVSLEPNEILRASETYTVTVKAGAFSDENGNVSDQLRFSFTTARPVDITSYGVKTFTVDPSATWITGAEVTFSAAELERAFKYYGRSLQSYDWSFGDARIGTGISCGHAYIGEGQYTATLTITDVYGFEYSFAKEIMIEDFESANVRIDVSPNYTIEFWHEDTYGQWNPGYQWYKVYLIYNNTYMTDETVRAYLYKNGRQVKYIGSAVTGKGNSSYYDPELGRTFSDRGLAMIQFNYKDPDLYGTYELVFEYGSGEAVKTTRVPVIIADDRSKQALYLRLLHKDTGEYVESPYGGYYFLVDGEQVFGELQEVYPGEYYYVLKDIPIGVHEVKLFQHNAFTLYSSEKKSIYHVSTDHPDILLVEDKVPVVKGIRSSLSDSNSRYPAVFFRGVETPPIRFEIDGDWDFLHEGYYEYMLTKTGVVKKTWNPWFDLVPGTLLPEEKLMVRMVTHGGRTSEWVDAKIETTPPPVLSTDLEFEFVNDNYLVKTPMNFANIVGGKIGSLSDMPLLSHAESFGLTGSNNMFVGKIKKTGGGRWYIDFQIDAEGSYTKTKKKPKMVVVGYQIDVGFKGNLKVFYNGGESWEVDRCTLLLWGDLRKTYEKGFEVPKINVGVKGSLYIGAYASIYMDIDKRPGAKREYSGILHFEPYVMGRIFAGLKWVSVEGTVDGRIPAEVHIPTGYVSVDPSLTAKITGTFATYSKTLFKETLSTHWDNGREKVQSVYGFADDTAWATLDTGNSGLTQLPRNYLNSPSKWYEGQNALLNSAGLPILADASARTMMLAAQANPFIEVRKENVYPYADVLLARNENNSWLIWTDDDVARNPVNRTSLQYSVYQGGQWIEPEKMDDDGTADFTPAVAAAGDGVLMAWQDINQEMAANAELGDVIVNAEISVTEKVQKPGETADVITLTNDDLFDHSPAIAASGDKALLVWTKSEGLSFTMGDDMDQYKATANSDSLWYSVWDGEDWSTAQALDSDMPYVVSTHLSFSGDEGLLVYTLDEDSNLETMEDTEVYARTFRNGAWGSAVRLTDNDVADDSPKAVYVDGHWVITWLQDSSLAWKLGLDGVINTQELPGTVQKYEIAVLADAQPQIALVYQQMGEKGTQNLSALFLDIRHSTLSNQIPLTTGEGFVRSFSPVFTSDGKLQVAFTKAEMMVEVIEDMEFNSPGQKVELCLLTYTPVNDLGFSDEDGLSLDPEIPIRGTTTNVTVVVNNQGDFAQKATVILYDGPVEDGKELARTTTEQAIPARSSAQVSLEWSVDETEQTAYDIYARVVAVSGAEDADESNNTISRVFSALDLELTEASYRNVVDDIYLVTARVSNKGATVLNDIDILLKQGENALDQAKLKELTPGQEGAVTFNIKSKGLAASEDGIHVSLKTQAKDAAEANTDNNVAEIILNPEVIFVKSSAPADDEKRISITSPIQIGFNMNVEPGPQFDRITLTDDALNTVPVTVAIEGNKLIITPKSALDYQTRYTLSVPENAVTTSYGHEMSDAYSLSFVTTTSAPEVVFAWPGDGLDEISPDTEIKIQYNRAIMQGTFFSGIALYRGQEKVTAEVSVQDEWITVKPLSDLIENTEYSLTIPAGAVKNAEDEIQQQEYMFSFVTAEQEDSSNPDDDDNDDESQGGSTGGSPADTQQPAKPLDITRDADGTVRAIINLNETDIHNLSNEEGTVLLDLSEEKESHIAVELSVNTLKQLVAKQKNLLVRTSKGDILLPAAFLQQMLESGETPVTILAEENAELSDAENRVSAGVYNFSIQRNGAEVTEFDPKLTVTLPLDMSAVGNPKRVIVCVYDEATGVWIPVGGVSDGENGTITFTTSHFSTYAAFEHVKQFDDLTAEWAKEKVEILASRMLVNGKAEDRFAPEDTITRAEAVALMVRSLYTDYTSGKSAFTDVPDDAWFRQEVLTAYDLGLTNGVGGGLFAPHEPVTREQLATMAVRLYLYKNEKLPEGLQPMSFTDEKEISDFAAEAVRFVSGTGIMVGYDGRFDPKRTASRQEMAVMLYRLLEYMGEL
jgi:methionine-rich copper-binding protein CopC